MKNTCITINNIVKFEEIKVINEAIIEKKINNRIHQGKISISPTDPSESVNDYKKYILHYDYFQKVNAPIKIAGELTDYIQHPYIFTGYQKENYFITISDLSHKVVFSGIKELNSKTKIKCEPLKIDLKKLVEKVIKTPEVEICSGWFGKLNLANLDSVSLKGDDVDKSEDWERFKKIPGSTITTVEIFFTTGDFEGIKIMISTKGFIFLKNYTLEVTSSLKLAEKIISIINN